MLAPIALLLAARSDLKSDIDRLRVKGLTELGAHRMLTDLTTNVGARLSGSPGAAKAVVWVGDKLRAMGLRNVREVPCMVPHWVRGQQERASMTSQGNTTKLSVCALGMSVATPSGGVKAQVIEVGSLEEMATVGEKARGKVVFFNKRFDATLSNTFEAYGGAVGTRFGAASAAAKYGAVAVMVRSMTLANDDFPHTGAMGYEDGVNKVAAVALGAQSADRLSEAIHHGRVTVKLETFCKTLPDAPSASVAGEIVGTEKPNEVIVLGGHLDSWDLGRGAHDDGAGVTQAMEALRLIKGLGWKPKRTIRVVAWMNEENGGRGAKSYADMAAQSGQKHVMAMESDSGGFMPRAVGVSKEKVERVAPWLDLLRPFGVEQFREGGADADNGPLEAEGAALFSLEPENQRYFDYHHTASDTIDKVNARELEMGALVMASLAWLCSEEGVD
ncbi:MAG: M20/M25/M40 family metallo-hydrolase [Armatimonadetes bacterium]|nr:M20/M25/M40 family metallo-hydrolase [Armatimonadota bacterium]